MNQPAPKQSPNPTIPAPLALGPQGRAVGLDVHPDTFAAAVLEGREALRARVVQSVTQQPLATLGAWATRYTTEVAEGNREDGGWASSRRTSSSSKPAPIALPSPND